MRAIILAAGEGVRLRPFTLDRPKCLVELAGKPLLVHQFEALEAAGIGDVTVVTGYRAEQIAAFGRPTRHNADYARTNMVASLMCAADLLDGDDDLLIAYADIVYEPRVIEALCACSEPLCTTVDRSWLGLWWLRMPDPLSDAEALKLHTDGDIVEIGRPARSLDEIQGQYMGLIKVAAGSAPGLVAAYEEIGADGTVDGKGRDGMYMTAFLQHVIDQGRPVRAVAVEGGWLEVDTSVDLGLYNQLHREGRLDEYCRLGAVAAQVWQR